MTRIRPRRRPSGAAVLGRLILAHANSAAFGRDRHEARRSRSFGWSGNMPPCAGPAVIALREPGNAFGHRDGLCRWSLGPGQEMLGKILTVKNPMPLLDYFETIS